ncbi:hypothetical protein Tco_1542291, partial [Tanacetum coccineum]
MLNEKFWISSYNDPVNWLLEACKVSNIVADVDMLFRKSKRFPSNVLPEITRRSSFLPNNGHNLLGANPIPHWSTTDSSSLMKQIQKSQVVLVDILENLVENDSIVAEHGLSSEITQSLGGSSDTSEGSENSRSFKDNGRSDEEYSEDKASSKKGGSETPQ